MYFFIHGSSTDSYSGGRKLFLSILFRQAYLMEFKGISMLLNYPHVYKLNSGIKTFKI